MHANFIEFSRQKESTCSEKPGLNVFPADYQMKLAGTGDCKK